MAEKTINVRVSRTDILRAVRAGMTVAGDGDPVTRCPYDPNASDPRHRLFAAAWCRGYAAGSKPD